MSKPGTFPKNSLENLRRERAYMFILFKHILFEKYYSKLPFPERKMFDLSWTVPHSSELKRPNSDKRYHYF